MWMRPSIRTLGISTGILALVGLGLALYAGLSESEKPAVLRFTRLTNDGIYKDHLTTLLSDGSRVYFSGRVDTTTYLAEVSVSGGETTLHESPFSGASAMSYSSRTNEILFGAVWEQSSEQLLTVMSMPGGAAHPVGDLGAHAASWSPDSTKIAYAKGTNLYTANADGSNAHEIARMKGVPHWPRWSPDGKRIRFSEDGWGQEMSLWEILADGQELHPLFPHEAWAKHACCGEWSPDGRYYIFVVDDARRSSLWVVRLHKWWQFAEPMVLAEGPVDYWRSPLVAPDGKHIFALGAQPRGELLKYDPKSREFQPYLGGLSTDTIAFSRDGQWIAYTAYPEGTLWRSRTDGSERLKLTESPGFARYPQWSPDGSQIVYIDGAAGKPWKIYKVASKGGKIEAVFTDNTSQGVATWSPDGTRIAFGEIVVYGVNQKQKEQIRILDLKQGTAAVVPGSDGMWTARWSPDGRYLSAVTVDKGKLMLYDFQSQQWSELANLDTNDVVWGRDGETIYFDCSNDPVIYRANVKNRKLEKYISLKGLRRTGFFGLSLNIAPDNNPVLLREAGIQEIYSLQVSLP
jgi:Tol biopolymer transport system component